MATEPETEPKSESQPGVDYLLDSQKLARELEALAAEQEKKFPHGVPVNPNAPQPSRFIPGKEGKLKFTDRLLFRTKRGLEQLRKDEEEEARELSASLRKLFQNNGFGEYDKPKPNLDRIIITIDPNQVKDAPPFRMEVSTVDDLDDWPMVKIKAEMGEGDERRVMVFLQRRDGSFGLQDEETFITTNPTEIKDINTRLQYGAMIKLFSKITSGEVPAFKSERVSF